MDDILLIDKLAGMSSFQVIRRLRKELNIKKMGHAGTLDPMATGLLIIGIGAGTKKLHAFSGLPKVYEAEILLGTKTDTGDVTGVVTETVVGRNFSQSEIVTALQSMVGEITLPVPFYSALKQKGKPLYKYAREGKSVPIPKSVMQVDSVELLSTTENTVSARIAVSSGTYIRSLAEELGVRLGTVATLKNLRRISIGQFGVTSARLLQ